MGFSAVVAVALAGTAASVSASSKQRKAAQQAQEKQDAELKKQAAIQAKADKLVSEETARGEAKATERRTRLSRGRKGLLFEGKETGVATTDVLGG